MKKLIWNGTSKDVSGSSSDLELEKESFSGLVFSSISTNISENAGNIKNLASAAIRKIDTDIAGPLLVFAAVLVIAKKQFGNDVTVTNKERLTDRIARTVFDVCSGVVGGTAGFTLTNLLFSNDSLFPHSFIYSTGGPSLQKQVIASIVGLVGARAAYMWSNHANIRKQNSRSNDDL